MRKLYINEKMFVVTFQKPFHDRAIAGLDCRPNNNSVEQIFGAFKGGFFIHLSKETDESYGTRNWVK